MRVWLCLIACLISLDPHATQGESNTWQPRVNKLLRSIVPIETTADEVKKQVGEPINKSPDFHEFGNFNVLVSYTNGISCEQEPDGWKVPRDRVITFTIIVKAAFHQKDLKNFGIDLSKYEKDVDESGHSRDVIYTNIEAGTSVYLNGDQVTSIALFPAKRYLQLMCAERREKPICPAETERSAVLHFQHFRHEISRLGWSEER